MERKIYKPGQIVTVHTDNKHVLCRITKGDGTGYCCKECYLYPTRPGLLHTRDISKCRKYCFRVHNDWDKNPDGYYLKQISPKSQEG